MRKYLLTAFLISAMSIQSIAQLVSNQSVIYEYDMRGNRVKRYVYVNKKNDSKIPNESIGKVYPNPASNVFTIEFADETVAAGIEIIKVLDYSGRLVLQQVEFSESKALVSVESLSSGTYTILVLSGETILQYHSLVINN